jgi:hypothetical protein
MTKSTATALMSTARAELEGQFTEWARESFTQVFDAMYREAFYKTVMRRLDSKTNITDEVPEMVGMSERDVREVVLALGKQAHDELKKTWELATHYQPCFLTTVRTVTAEDEVLPQYDVEYAGRDYYAGAKVKISTWRRNLKVEVIGTDRELEAMQICMSQAALSVKVA